MRRIAEIAGGVMIVAMGLALAVLFSACAGPGERWACRAADGAVVTCRTVAAP